MMVHKFDVHDRKKLESEERKCLLAPNDTLHRLGYQAGETMADIGCGIGLFTIPAAEIGGNGAKIYAIDVADEMLSEVKSRSEALGYSNIVTLKSEEYDFKLPNDSVDFVFICTVLHEVEDKLSFLKEASRICRKGGKISVIEFEKNQTALGPPLSHRIAREKVGELLIESGFVKTKDFAVSEAFYAVTALKV